MNTPYKSNLKTALVSFVLLIPIVVDAHWFQKCEVRPHQSQSDCTGENPCVDNGKSCEIATWTAQTCVSAVVGNCAMRLESTQSVTVHVVKRLCTYASAGAGLGTCNCTPGGYILDEWDYLGVVSRCD